MGYAANCKKVSDMSKQKLTVSDCHFYGIVFSVLGGALIGISIALFTLSFFAGVFLFLFGVFLLFFSSAMRSEEKELKGQKAQAEESAKKQAAAEKARSDMKLRQQEYAEQRRKQVEQASAAFAAIPRAAVEQLPTAPDDGSEPLECKHSTLTARTKLDEFVVIDTETTGLHKGRDKILELGAVRFVGGKPVEIFETLVNPGRPIPKEVTAINHITDDMVSGCPTIREVLPAFDRFIGASNVVGHNLDFDLGFILKAGSRMAHTKRRYYCILEQSKKILKTPKRKWDSDINAYVKDIDGDWDVEDCKLSTLCKYYGIVAPDAHRASADAYVTGQLLLCLADSKKEAANV